VSMVATTAQLTLAQISVNFYHGDQGQPTFSLLPDLEMANEIDGARLTAKLYFEVPVTL
jgi:hypothetical protein